MERGVDIFRCIAKGTDTPSVEREWIEGLISEMSRENAYIQGTVRRELQIMQFGVGNISNQKLEQMRCLLAGKNERNCLDDAISMYI